MSGVADLRAADMHRLRHRLRAERWCPTLMRAEQRCMTATLMTRLTGAVTVVKNKPERSWRQTAAPRALSCRLALCFGGLSAIFSAPIESQELQQLERTEITGSLLKVGDRETALPVVIITAEDLQRAGVKTLDAALQFISQNQSLFNSASGIGAGLGGAAFADLRGLGTEHTLVLLNGQRVVKNPYLDVGTDVNVIPTVAIQRIEVLTDGASAIYGTDAIAGVINIITRRDFEGLNIGASAKLPQARGGDQYNGNFTYGYGALATQGFNVFAGVDFTREQRIRPADRDYASSGFIPDKGLARTSGTTFPGNYFQPATGVESNPSLPGCAPPDSVPIPSLYPNSCRFDFARYTDIAPETERWSLLARGTLAAGANHSASVEYFRAYNKLVSNFAPTLLTSLPMTAANPFYPGGSAGVPITDPNLDPTQPISVGWRTVVAGPRATIEENTTQRLLAELEGALANWNYRVTAHGSDSKVDVTFTNGYVNEQRIVDGLLGANGAPFLNPFGPQTEAGAAYIESNKIVGRMQHVEGKLYGINGTLSGELMHLPAGPLGFAVGAEYRKETIDFRNSRQPGTGFETAEDVNGSIRNYALYTELNVPIARDLPFIKRLEVPLSIRYDNYDLSGGTTNPKIGVAWQTTDNLLIRGSYNKGFRVGSVFNYFGPNTIGLTSGTYDDPVLCPNGVPVPGANPTRDCHQQFQSLQGANRNLKPETSDAWLVGFVLDFARRASVTVDYFDIRLKETIWFVPEEEIFGDPVTHANKLVRCSQLAPARAAVLGCVPGAVDPLAYIDQRLDNLGTFRSTGYDVAVNARSDPTSIGQFSFGLHGTYLTKLAQQLVKGGEYFDFLGRCTLGFANFRWQHVIQLGWERGTWSGSLFNRFKSGYDDCNVGTLDDNIYGHNKVGNWSVYDVTLSYQAVKGLTLTGGVLNLFDTKPPFSNQQTFNQAGYNPSMADPVGRAFFVQAAYQFK